MIAIIANHKFQVCTDLEQQKRLLDDNIYDMWINEIIHYSQCLGQLLSPQCILSKKSSYLCSPRPELLSSIAHGTFNIMLPGADQVLLEPMSDTFNRIWVTYLLILPAVVIGLFLHMYFLLAAQLIKPFGVKWTHMSEAPDVCTKWSGQYCTGTPLYHIYRDKLASYRTPIHVALKELQGSIGTAYITRNAPGCYSV